MFPQPNPRGISPAELRVVLVRKWRRARVSSLELSIYANEVTYAKSFQSAQIPSCSAICTNPNYPQYSTLETPMSTAESGKYPRVDQLRDPDQP